ncbi:PREDICTED: lysozyme B-like [Bactrocera latifrons]|uniref:lysozyme B-like n=1 Tax=Bactrocera latifrons TaxID=174628 RepID=UPI0008DD904D|nr:PREDICTED: lysozyme B-like [Bactrocera latifrons]
MQLKYRNNLSIRCVSVYLNRRNCLCTYPNFHLVHLLDRCSLARKMSRFGVPRDQLARWACIAEHESTDVVGPTNYNGSNEYGLFQINDYYRCQPASGRFSYNQCHIDCNGLLTNNIEPIVRCAQEVLRMQGWSAWSTCHCCDGYVPNIEDSF